MTTRHTLTLILKIQLIRENEAKFLYRTLADKFKILIGSISNIINHKAEHMGSYEESKQEVQTTGLILIREVRSHQSIITMYVYM